MILTNLSWKVSWLPGISQYLFSWGTKAFELIFQSLKTSCVTRGKGLTFSTLVSVLIFNTGLITGPMSNIVFGVLNTILNVKCLEKCLAHWDHSACNSDFITSITIIICLNTTLPFNVYSFFSPIPNGKISLGPPPLLYLPTTISSPRTVQSFPEKCGISK